MKAYDPTTVPRIKKQPSQISKETWTKLFSAHMHGATPNRALSPWTHGLATWIIVWTLIAFFTTMLWALS